jgi:hypothetical protein
VNARALIALLLFVAAAGCSRYTQAEIDLATQARRGVALARESQAAHAALAQRYRDVQRKRLDDAFDADVRAQAQLTPDWVIEHGRGYAVGIDALDAQDRAAAANLDAARRTLDATDEALAKLQWLQLVRQAYLSPQTYLNPQPKEGKP